MFSINKVHDVLGTDVSDLEAVPGSIKAIILLLPKDDKYNQRLEEKNADVGVSAFYFSPISNFHNTLGTKNILHSSNKWEILWNFSIDSCCCQWVGIFMVLCSKQNYHLIQNI